MSKFLTKKVLALITIASLIMAVGAVAYADSTLKQVTAYQNQAMKVTVNGKEIDSSTAEGTMYPLVYDGHSYVSAKTLAEALGATVKWNGDTNTVEVTNGAGNSIGNPTKDNSSQPQATQSPQQSGHTDTTAPVLSYDKVPDQATALHDFSTTAEDSLTWFLVGLTTGDYSDLKTYLNKIGYKDSAFHGPSVNYKEIANALDHYVAQYSTDEKKQIAALGATAITNKAWDKTNTNIKVDKDEKGFYLTYEYVLYMNNTYHTLWVNADFSSELSKTIDLKDIHFTLY
jgi:hypothetical protein